ncbi:TonB-dependent receptor plug [Gemmatirosa kalamazoonensis]|uniref:TonB-dependent receptor plug n=1 Tax=Gemmatirosa kalamazoonensis TaxID=861299 RepID=W0RIV2_9BACT|nr:carboxypeptidase regulatory-like domain-containing protein [Gemmatirosa kalamazoonensis]AHG90367.1 TonB-dependent receptor plug [Gemmatirosa kalamazoonensis]
MSPISRTIPLVVAALTAASSLGAQPRPATGAVRVRVASAVTGEGVPRAVVSLDAPNAAPRRLSADDAGVASFGGLAAHAWTVHARALGYRPAASTVNVRAGDTTVVTLRLDPAPQTLEAMRAEEHATERGQFERTPDPGAITLTGRAMRSVPSIGEPDVLRAAQLLAGVVARNDYTAGYNVRGGESDQNLVLLDGIPVYNPFHLGGLFGTFIDQAVGSVDMLVGGFPAEYGGRLSSVLDVHTREPERAGVHGTVGVSMLTSSATLGGTVDDGRGAWTVGARRTYIDKVVGALTSKTLPYHFQDAQGSARWAVGGGTLSLTAYAGSDDLGGSFADFGDSSQAGGGAFAFRWGNRLAGLAYRRPLGGGRWRDSARVSQRASVTAFSTLLDLGAGTIRFSDDLLEMQAAGQLLAWHGAHQPRVGYELSHLAIDYDVTSTGSGAALFTLRQRPTALSLYADDLWKPDDRLLARLGVRAEGVSGARWAGISPRASVRWFATPDLAFTVAAGQYAQWTHALRNEDVPVRIFDFWIASDRYTPVSTATHAIAGAERWFGARTFVRAEGYAKRYRHLVEPNDADDPAVRGDEFRGVHGWSYGADVLVRRLEGSRFSGWLAYGYGVGSRAHDALGDGASPGGVLSTDEGAYWPAQDRRHNLNLVGSWKLGRGYVLGTRFGYGSGTPFTDVTGQIVRRLYDGSNNTWDTGVNRPGPEPVGGARNASRYPPFHRLDLGVTRTFVRGRTTWTPSLQLINVYNRQNTFVYAFDYQANPPTRTAISQFPLLPSVGLTVEF